METNYRSADMIELHDSGFIIVRKGYSEGSNGWREYITLNGRSYAIDGEQFLRLAEYFHIDYRPTITDSSSGKEIRSELRGETFLIQTESIKIGSSVEGSHYEALQVIKELSAWIESPQLLHMKAVFTYEVTDSGSITIEEVTKHITYSGRFTVWWSNTDTKIPSE